MSTSIVGMVNAVGTTTTNLGLTLPTVGLFNWGNELNTAIIDIDTAFGTVEYSANKGMANGYAPLDSNALIPTSLLPASVLGAMSYVGVWNANANRPVLASGSGTKGQYYKVSVSGSTTLDGNTSWHVGDFAIFDGTAWDKVDNFESVTTVAGRIGDIVLSSADLTDVALFAKLASPTFSGTLTSPAINATTGFQVNGSALASTNLSDSSALARLASPIFTGTVTAPTLNVTTTLQINGTAIASTNLSDSSLLARLASPTFTGVPAAPTAAAGTNTTQLATTAFAVGAAIGIANLASGYQKFASGLIMQWGTVSGTSGTVTYNSACPFTTVVFPMVSSMGAGYAHTSSPSLTSFAWSSTFGINWHAIGY